MTYLNMNHLFFIFNLDFLFNKIKSNNLRKLNI